MSNVEELRRIAFDVETKRLRPEDIPDYVRSLRPRVPKLAQLVVDLATRSRSPSDVASRLREATDQACDQ
jgi:hypothetical protein